MTEASLIRPWGMAGFVLLAAVGLRSVVPDDLEMAKLRLKSFDYEGAEPLLKKMAGREPGNPAIQRLLAETLEAQGKIHESIKASEAMIELRPQNQNYRQRMIRLHEWNGDAKNAIQNREALLTAGLTPIHRGSVMQLAREYEWLQQYDRVMKLYMLAWSTNSYDAEDIEKMVRFFLSRGSTGFATKFALESVERGVATKQTQRGLSLAFAAISDISNALRFLGIYFGISPRRAATMIDDAMPLDSIAPELVRNDQTIFEDFVWLYLRADKKAAAVRAMDRIRSDGKIKKAMHFYLAELSMEIERESVEPVLREISEREDLDDKDWRNLAAKFLLIGKSGVSEKILESLLRRKTPSLEDESTHWTLVGEHRLAYEGENPLLILARAEASRAPRAGDTDRIRTYRQLIEVYDARGDNKKAIEVVGNILGEVRRGELVMSGTELRDWTESLAERHTWESDARSALDALSSLPFASQSPKGRAIYALSLDELGDTLRAGQAAAEIKQTDRSALGQETSSRLSDLDSRYAKARELASVESVDSAAGASVVVAPPKVVTVDARAHMTNGQGLTVPGLEVKGRYGAGALGWVGRLGLRWVPMIEARVGEATAGAEYLHSGMTYRLLAGGVAASGVGTARGGYFPLAVNASVAGSLPGFDYFIVDAHLAKPLTDTRELAQRGVSEGVLSIYAEQSPVPWATLALTAQGKLTHEGHLLAEGSGMELGGRFGFGPASGWLRAGPWIHFVRWGSDSPSLQGLLVPRYTILGGFGSLVLGGGAESDWRGRLSAGLGADFSADSRALEAGFVEFSLEKSWADAIGLRIDYGVYTTRVTSVLGAAFHVASLSVTKGW